MNPERVKEIKQRIDEARLEGDHYTANYWCGYLDKLEGKEYQGLGGNNAYRSGWYDSVFDQQDGFPATQKRERI